MPEPRSIVIKGAREHNLKNLDLAIPRDQLVVIAGLSGAVGTLVFLVIFGVLKRS
jgi:excinuclease ABC subunit A